MKGKLFVVFLALSASSFGQSYNSSSSSDSTSNTPDLTVLTNILKSDVLKGFSRGNGRCGYGFNFDSSMTFQKVDFCCTGDFIVDNGTWKIKNNTTVILKSKRETLAFDVLKFDNFIFFILPAERDRFFNDLNSARARLKKTSLTFSNKRYSADYIAAYSLMEKYYAREIEENTGT